MNAPKLQHRESGQVIVLLAVGLLALLGLTAVAIDGGMIYADRRYDQNAADAASYAAAGAAAMSLENNQITYYGFDCGRQDVINAGSDGVNAAVARAASNNFAVDNNIDDQQGVVASCGIEKIDNVGALYDKHLDFRTMISSDLQTAFAHLFYKGNVRNTVEATTRVRPRSDLAYGYAITSLSDSCSNSNGMDFSGDSTVKVHTTGIFSNSCITTNGGILVQTIAGPSGTQPAVAYYDTLTPNGTSGTVDAPKLNTNQKVPREHVPAPDCAAAGNDYNSQPSLPKDTLTDIEPGRYHNGIKLTNDDILNMKPGLYCLYGDFDAQGGEVYGTGVTIYMVSGSMKITGQTKVQLEAPMGEAKPAIRGMLFYAAEDNLASHQLSGGSESWFTGTIYAPYGSLEIGGNNGVGLTFTTQIVANYVKVHGTEDMEINFDAVNTYNHPAYVELYR